MPAPADLTFTFAGYSLRFSSEERQSLAANGGVLLAVLILWGWSHWIGQRLLNRIAYRRLLPNDKEAKCDPYVACAVEAAFEGYRVARDTYAPHLARKHLREAQRLLIVGDFGCATESWSVIHSVDRFLAQSLGSSFQEMTEQLGIHEEFLQFLVFGKTALARSEAFWVGCVFLSSGCSIPS